MSGQPTRIFVKKGGSGSSAITTDPMDSNNIIITPVQSFSQSSSTMSQPTQFVLPQNDTRIVQESTAPVTYKVIHVPPEVLNQGHIIQNVSSEQRVVDTNTAGQQIQIINFDPQVSNDLPLPTLSAQSSQRPPTYVQSTANTVQAGTGNMQIQLQAVDTPTGQCYLLMTPDVATNSQRPITTSSKQQNVQQATFIPLSRIESSGGSTTQQILPMMAQEPELHKYTQKRRDSHNEVEKRRRDKINQWINKLAKLLPESDTDEDPARSLQSKGSVLAKTCEFIQQLKDTNQQLAAIGETLELASKEQLDAIALRMEVEQLLGENAKMRQKLADLGVTDYMQEPPAKRPRTYTITVSANPGPSRSVNEREQNEG